MTDPDPGSTCTRTRCRCRCCAARRTRPGRPRRRPPRSSGSTRGSAASAPVPRCRWRASQYDVAVRLSEMDGAGVSHHAVSLPPFLFCSTADDRAVRTETWCARGNDELAVYVADGPGPPGRAGFGAAGLAGRRRGGPALPRRAGHGRHRDRQPGRRPRPRRPGQRRAVGAAGRARVRSSSCTPAAYRTPRGSATSTCRSSSATRWRPRSRWPAWSSAACWSAST